MLDPGDETHPDNCVSTEQQEAHVIRRLASDRTGIYGDERTNEKRLRTALEFAIGRVHPQPKDPRFHEYWSDGYLNMNDPVALENPAPFDLPTDIEGNAMQSTRHREFPRRFVAVVTMVLLAYVLSYVALRTRGLRQMQAFDNVGILYTDVETTFRRKDLTTHLLLAVFYFPANELDCAFFGGEPPIQCILFELT